MYRNILRFSFFILFILSVTYVNIWNYFKCGDTFPNSTLTTTSKFITYNFMVSEYSFFSPNICDSYSMAFYIKNKTTHKLEEQPIFFYNREVVNKIFSVCHKFYIYKDIRNYLAYSFASYFFSVYPDQKEVIFTFSLYKLPSMQHFRKGDKPVLKLIYAKEYFNE
jgi:hypothetical protein